MLARLQQCITIGLLAAAAAWAWALWPAHPVTAAVGAMLILLGFALILAIEFAMLARMHGADPAPRATPAELLRAWWGEAATTPVVFFWRQPFRSEAEPDCLIATSDAPGVVLVHGLFCNRGFWNPWMRTLRAQGRAFIAVNLEPAWGSLDAHVDTVAQAVRRLTEATGRPPLLVGHSMGGLVARHWLAVAAGPAASRPFAAVCRVVTIATPHGGTWIARLSPTLHGRQMGLQSDWLRQLESVSAPGVAARFVCWYSNADNMVFPPSTACLPGADNRFVPVTAHVALGLHPRVMAETLALRAP